MLITLVFISGVGYSQVAINNDNSAPDSTATVFRAEVATGFGTYSDAYAIDGFSHSRPGYGIGCIGTIIVIPAINTGGCNTITRNKSEYTSISYVCG